MEDPNQDQLMSHYFAYFRVKKMKLGNAYMNYILKSLEKGGTIVIVDCQKEWPVTKVADRYFFQSGAFGGLHPEGKEISTRFLLFKNITT